jgi:hypothetical protein
MRFGAVNLVAVELRRRRPAARYQATKQRNTPDLWAHVWASLGA